MVKALDCLSNGLCPRGFESHPRRRFRTERLQIRVLYVSKSCLVELKTYIPLYKNLHVF